MWGEHDVVEDVRVGKIIVELSGLKSDGSMTDTAPPEDAMTDPKDTPALSQLNAIRPELEGRSGHCKSCRQMLVVIDQLELLHQTLHHEAGYQEYIDACLNARAFRKAADAVLEADSTLANAAALMSFTRHA